MRMVVRRWNVGGMVVVVEVSVKDHGGYESIRVGGLNKKNNQVKGIDVRLMKQVGPVLKLFNRVAVDRNRFQNVIN